jgi:prepilin-type N-terminal cleavage/methylation domain-containing protein
MRIFPTTPRATRAFTLLEVILALAILAGAVAVLGEIMRSAGRNAADAQAETRAQLLACSLMDEMVTGVLEPTEQSQVALNVDDVVPWVYSVRFGTTNIEGLMAVELVVEQDLEAQFNPVRYRLVRWLPSVTEAVEEDEEEAEETEESSEENTEQGDSTEGGDAQ